MNIRVTALSLVLGVVTSASAFADPVPCAQPAQPVAAQAVYARPVYAQPVYARPTQVAVGQPVYAQPVYAQPVAAQPVYTQAVYTQPAYGQPAYGQPAYGQPAYGQYGQRRDNRRETFAFVNSLRTRLAQADQQLRVSVARGAVNPQALNVFNAERAQVEATLAQAARDGFLAPMEQSRLDRMAARLERLDEQFRVPVAPVAARPWGFGRGHR